MSTDPFAARVNDPNSAENAVVLAALTGALTLVEPRALRVGGRLLYRSALAALTGWMTWSLVRDEEEYILPATAKVGITMGAVGTTLALSEAGEALDRAINDSLTRMGVSRPRFVMAAATAGFSIASSWLGRQIDNDSFEFEDADGTEGGSFEDEAVETPSEVRDLIAALIERTDNFGSAEIRAQLEQVRAHIYLGEDPDTFYPGIGFSVPADLPRAVPGNGNFPVIGRYRPIDGKTFDVVLLIQDGRLANLDVVTGSDWSDDENLEWMMTDRSTQEITRWPRPDELEFLIETPNGLIPASS